MGHLEASNYMIPSRTLRGIMLDGIEGRIAWEAEDHKSNNLDMVFPLICSYSIWKSSGYANGGIPPLWLGSRVGESSTQNISREICGTTWILGKGESSLGLQMNLNCFRVTKRPLDTIKNWLLRFLFSHIRPCSICAAMASCSRYWLVISIGLLLRILYKKLRDRLGL